MQIKPNLTEFQVTSLERVRGLIHQGRCDADNFTVTEDDNIYTTLNEMERIIASLLGEEWEPES